MQEVSDLTSAITAISTKKHGTTHGTLDKACRMVTLMIWHTDTYAPGVYTWHQAVPGVYTHLLMHCLWKCISALPVQCTYATTSQQSKEISKL